jgi:diguanylate cyclase (GGDEF)-like protein/PAS domain S-box-containing protein
MLVHSPDLAMRNEHPAAGAAANLGELGGATAATFPGAPAPERHGDRFRQLVEQSLAGMYVIRGEQFVYVNPRFCEIFGYGPAELTAISIDQLVAVPDRPLVRENLRRRLAGEVYAVHYLFRGLHRSGAQLELETHGSRTEVMGHPGVMGTLIDVTGRRRADEAIRESEERYALAALGASDGLWDWDLRRGSIYFSPRWAAQVGVAPDDLGDDPNAWLGRVHADDRRQLQAEISLHLEGRAPHLEAEYRLRHEDGQFRWMLARGLAVRDPAGSPFRMAGSQTDITLRKRAEAKLAHDALHDALTGLPNRSLFMDRLGQAMAFQRRRADYRYACLFLDVDRFKTINESLGLFRGDQLLVALARRIQRCVNPGDTVARLGGDEFSVLLEDFADEEEPLRVAERIHQELAGSHDLEGTEVFVSASVGLVRGRPAHARPEELLRDAEIAMYRAKEQGRSRTALFEQGMQVRARALLQLETDLRRALERGELQLGFQPVVNLATGQIAGCEALCTWTHPLRGKVSPADFIPLAEENGLIVPIGAWVLQEACRAARQWKRPGAPLTMAVNLSARQLGPELLGHVRSALVETGLPPQRLRLEITESVLMEHKGPATPLLAQLKALGVHLLLDDFGTGYSSLSYLHEFRFDTLKIDRSFVARLGSGKPTEIVRSIVSLAGTLGMEVVAEGVETPAQVAQLRELGAGFAQGFFFSRPIDAEAFERLLLAKNPWPVSVPPPARGK